jgi:hypothetical protein
MKILLTISWLIGFALIVLLYQGCSKSVDSDEMILITSDNIVLRPSTYQVIYTADSYPRIKYNGRIYNHYEYEVITKID